MAGAAETRCRFVRATAPGPGPGAIAIIMLDGDVVPVLAALTGRGDWRAGEPRLVRFGDIDEGVALRLGERSAQLMPHGGPRVVQKLAERLVEIGAAALRADPDPAVLYPEAADRVEGLVLAALARAASPLAIDLLLEQPARWRGEVRLTAEDRARSSRLDRLIDPPAVVIAGPVNVGKSTLCNALLGRPMSIAADEPGTTRDYTRGRADLAGLVVDLHDTPGLRSTGDPVERSAQQAALDLMRRADLLVAVADAAQGWSALPRSPDMRITARCDLGARPGADLALSAVTGEGMEAFVGSVRDRLVPPADLAHPGPWLFDPRLATAP
jgi:tRNA modification GTPase